MLLLNLILTMVFGVGLAAWAAGKPSFGWHSAAQVFFLNLIGMCLVDLLTKLPIQFFLTALGSLFYVIFLKVWFMHYKAA